MAAFVSEKFLFCKRISKHLLAALVAALLPPCALCCCKELVLFLKADCKDMGAIDSGKGFFVKESLNRKNRV